MSFLPEVFEVDLGVLLAEPGAAATVLSCTDGIWDNWKFDDAINFAHDPVSPRTRGLGLVLKPASRASQRLCLGCMATPPTH